MKTLKHLFMTAALLLSTASFASEGGFAMDTAPDLSNDKAALQHGAKLFVNYCLNCHAAASMRYNRLKDIGLSDDQIKDGLLFSADKVGDLMKVSLLAKDAKEWFGAIPPDLSVIARAKAGANFTGADYLYTYLRTYYRDASRPTGWNNLAYPNSAMPHVLWSMQPTRALQVTETESVKNKEGKQEWVKKVSTYGLSGEKTTDAEQVLEGYGGHAAVEHKFINTDVPAQQQFDKDVGAIVAFMQYMADPSAQTRKSMGVWVLLFLCVFILFAYLLNKQYWKDIK